MVRVISSLVLLGALANSALARFVCPGGNPHDSGKGMAAFRYVEVFYDVQEANSASTSRCSLEHVALDGLLVSCLSIATGLRHARRLQQDV